MICDFLFQLQTAKKVGSLSLTVVTATGLMPLLI